ncbi:non-specific lipid-transfer protein 2P-like [Lolium rigidum]|uniref:non-specific lipid-transfer protein 2P-like n=1 Tax=Lolium rigidum TaxID=89674 RepID=UPI001F5D758B|nr:non-specific lipid-transfer protein 2P-like [Lolium rigidum]
MAMARAVATCAVLAVMMVAPSAVLGRAMAPARASAADQTCDVGKLIPCGPAIIGGTPPSDSCCSNLKAQEGCFCQYAKDPAYSGYIDSPNARKTLASCGITLPTCPR